MEIKFYATRWGYEEKPWPDFIKDIVRRGYKGVELYPFPELGKKKEILSCLADYGLELVLVQADMGNGANFNEYKNTLKRNLDVLSAFKSDNIKPRFINSQTGREYYTMSQMGECFRICDDFTTETEIPVYQETHRNKWAFAAHVVKEYLQYFPSLQLTLDISHWVCVSESYLQDQQEAVELAIQRAGHIHARVGHTQGPQVTNPQSPEYSEALNHHLKWWDKWLKVQLENGKSSCTITPEFGPFPYMLYKPFTNVEVSSQSEINDFMLQLIRNHYLQITH